MLLARLARPLLRCNLQTRIATTWPVRNAYSLSNIQKTLSDYPPEKIRNFSIIAHIDHGKSTLADRLMEITGCISKDSKNKQVLDKLQVERERGITVKAQSVSMFYTHKGEKYLLNLIDTPGHVDFSYEVSRSLSACQGALLLVDATKGIQAQTTANFFLAFEQDLSVLPIINKVDVEFADADAVASDIESSFELSVDPKLYISAKTGLNCESVLQAVIEKMPPPKNSDSEIPLRALLFDSVYSETGGTVCTVYIVDGSMAVGDKVYSCASGKKYEVREVGIQSPDPQQVKCLSVGQVGYVILGMKSCGEARVGDTFAKVGYETVPLPGFQPVKPVIFCSVFPRTCDDLLKLGDSMEKLLLNDSSVTVQSQMNTQLGRGYRLGFLGTLHMDVIQQRLLQEHGTSVVLTEPSVPFQIVFKDGKKKLYQDPAEFPVGDDALLVDYVEEPMIKVTLVFPSDYLVAMIGICERYRGTQIDFSYITGGRIQLIYRMPMMETVKDFYTQVKAITSGFANFDYEHSGFDKSDLKCLRVLINGKAFEPLTCLCHESNAVQTARALLKRVRKSIERQIINTIVQVSQGDKMLARDKIAALKTDHAKKQRLIASQGDGGNLLRQRLNMNLSYDCLVNLVEKD